MEANSSGLSTSNPLNNTAPNSDAALQILALSSLTYLYNYIKLLLPSFGERTNGKDYPITSVCNSSDPIQTSPLFSN